ncbi:MAG: hypothetical protein HRT45_07305 [Bdellovibrionales bacterium]|nr:hypothetical protein [Bdellovibrionales bacterium]
MNTVLQSKTRPSLISFIDKNPAKEHRQKALKALAQLVPAVERREMAEKFPDIVDYYSESEKLKFRLLQVGPADLRVKDVLRLRAEGVAEGTLVSKVKATAAAYKDFSFAEIKALKSLGLTELLINAMIDTNTEFEKQAKLAKANEEMMAQIKKLMEQSRGSVSAEQIRANPNTPVECIKQKAALKACESTSGLLKIGCEATARSNFECNF